MDCKISQKPYVKNVISDYDLKGWRIHDIHNFIILYLCSTFQVCGAWITSNVTFKKGYVWCKVFWFQLLIFIGIGLSGFLFRILYFYLDICFGESQRRMLLTCQNVLVSYNVYWQIEIIKPEEYEVNKWSKFKTIPNEVNQCINKHPNRTTEYETRNLIVHWQ